MKIVYLAINFSDAYFAVKERFTQLKNNQIKYFVQNQLVKSHFSMCKLLLDTAATAIYYVSLSLWILSKDFFTIQETAGS